MTPAEDAPASTRSYSYPGFTIAVTSHDTATLDWLTEFLSPWLDVGTRAAADYDVTFTVDRNALHGLRRQARQQPHPTVPGFVRDGRVVLSPIWDDGPGRRTMVLSDVRAAYRIAREERRVDVVAGAGTGRPRVALMRAVRETTIIAVRRQGALLVHGSAFMTGDRAVILAGPRETGKTTVMLHALQDPRLAFVANDRVFVAIDAEGQAVARGLPTIVAMRPGTLAMLPHLAARLAERRFAWPLSLDEVRGAGAGAEARPDVTPAQLCDLLGVTPASGGRLAAVVFPRPGGSDALELARLSPEAAVAAFTAALVGGVGPWATSGIWFDASFEDGPTAAETASRCRALVARVPIYECRIGARVLADRAAMQALVARVAGGE